jgi:uncharacterized protein YjbI with pentapeptide repeats
VSGLQGPSGPLSGLEGPRLLPVPAPLRDPELVDGTEWAGVEITGDVGGEAEVDSVDVAASRLANLCLTGRRIDGLHMVDVLVEDCELSGVTMPAAYLRRVEFRRCRMSGLSAPNLRAHHVRFSDCRADGASFRMSAWDTCELSEVNLGDVDFYGSKLTAVHFLGCDLSGADFSKTVTSALALHGSTLEDLKGAANLRGAIAGDQVLTLALRVFASMGIVIDDDYLSEGH